MKAERKLWVPSRSLVMPRPWYRQRGFLVLPALPNTFNVGAATFDGTNDFLSRGAGFTGAADSKTGILSLWLRIDGGDGTLRGIFNNVTTLGGGVGRCNLIHVAADNTIRMFAMNAAGSIVLAFNSATAYTAGATWLHVLLAWNLATPATHLLVNAVDDEASGTAETDDTIDYTLADAGVCALPDGTAKATDSMAEFYYAPGQYLDVSSAANYRKFITASGKPAYLGRNGGKPTGTAPLVYLHLNKNEAVASFATNRGTGGDFSITGTLDYASSSPSD